MQLCGASVMGEILALLNDSRFAGGDFKSSATTNPCRHIPSEDWQARMQALRRSLENALTPLSMEYSVDQANDDHLRALASMLKDIRGGEVPFEKDAFDEVAQKNVCDLQDELAKRVRFWECALQKVMYLSTTGSCNGAYKMLQLFYEGGDSKTPFGELGGSADEDLTEDCELAECLRGWHELHPPAIPLIMK